MKNILKISLILSIFVTSMIAAPSKATVHHKHKYLEDNKEKILVTADDKELLQQEGVMVDFADLSKLNLSEFESKYGLKLKTVMRIGYRIFDNVSQNTDVQIVTDIMEKETNVKTVKPNWKMKNKLY